MLKSSKRLRLLCVCFINLGFSGTHSHGASLGKELETVCLLMSPRKGMEPFAFLLPVLVNLCVTLKAGYILRGIKTDHRKENGVLSSRKASLQFQTNARTHSRAPPRKTRGVWSPGILMRSNDVFPDETMELELRAHVAGEDGALGVQDRAQAAVSDRQCFVLPTP